VIESRLDVVLESDDGVLRSPDSGTFGEDNDCLRWQFCGSDPSSQ
jgi:hypothetical protein